MDRTRMERSVVGGPLLGCRSLHRPGKESLPSWVTFPPMITPGISGKEEEQRFVLLPRSTCIAVLAYKTGKQCATLILARKNEERTVYMESVCLTRASKPKEASDMDVDGDNLEDLLMVGCRDGTIREFNLNELVKESNQASGLYRPRRVIRITSGEPIARLTCPLLSRKEGHWVYALVETSPSKPEYSLLRFHVPLYKRKLYEYDAREDPTLTKMDDFSCRRSDGDGSHHPPSTIPFRLESVVRPGKNNSEHVLLVVGRSLSVRVYHEEHVDEEVANQYTPLTVTAQPENPFCAVAISSNKCDITCGYWRGDIRVLTNLLPLVEDYNLQSAKYKEHKKRNAHGSTDKPVHPSKNITIQRVHWHAHPVASLCFDAASSMAQPMLYSGGDESVLVTWQLSRGFQKPGDTVARVAAGGIVHIDCTGPNPQGTSGILVYCEDNTLQLFESHNKARLWKLQGLAMGRPGGGELNNPVPLRVDPKSAVPLIVNVPPSAPGYIHWYDPRNQRVVDRLEVVPYNRISRTEHDDAPLPAPSVLHVSMSESGDDMLTVDIIPIDNVLEGASRPETSFGVDYSIKFWTRYTDRSAKGSDPFDVVAIMSSPHGYSNRISAATMSKDGKYACTTSNDEAVFRVWYQDQEVTMSEEGGLERRPAWFCQHKVTCPSGFSNLGTRPEAVAFSADSSLLAICFGRFITLWDHKETTLLGTLRHLDDDHFPIDTLTFINSGTIVDMILTKSRMGVVLQSPYGSDVGPNRGWQWMVANCDTSHVSSVALIASHNVVAVTVHENEGNKSRIFLIDAASGKPWKIDNGTEVTADVDGYVSCIVATGRTPVISKWSDPEERLKRDPLSLFVLTGKGEMISLKSGDDATGHLPQDMDIDMLEMDVPRLGQLQNARARPKEAAVSTWAVEPPIRTTMKNFGVFEGSTTGPLPTSELPSLSGAFLTAFLGRNLATNRIVSDEEDTAS